MRALLRDGPSFATVFRTCYTCSAEKRAINLTGRCNMGYRAVFFDLDGTITDSAPGILASMQQAPRKICHLSRRGTAAKICRPAAAPRCSPIICRRNRWKRGFGCIARFTGGGRLFDARIYDGIPQLLKCLSQNGLFVALATAKPKKTRRSFSHILDSQNSLTGSAAPRRNAALRIKPQ